MRDVLFAVGILLAAVAMFGPPLVEGVQPAQVFDHAVIPAVVVPDGAAAVVIVREYNSSLSHTFVCSEATVTDGWCDFVDTTRQRHSVPAIWVEHVYWASPQPVPAERET